MLSTSLFRCICSQGRPNSEAISTKDGSAFLRRTPLRRPRRVGGAWSPSSCAKRRSDSAVTGSSAVTLAQIHSTWVSFNLQGYQKQTPIGPQENRVSTKLNYTAANHTTVLSVRMSRFLSGTLHGYQRQIPIPEYNPSCKAQLSTIESNFNANSSCAKFNTALCPSPYSSPPAMRSSPLWIPAAAPSQGFRRRASAAAPT